MSDIDRLGRGDRMSISTTARITLLMIGGALVAACQTVDRGSEDKTEAIKSVRENFLQCTSRVAQDPTVQLISEEMPILPQDVPTAEMRSNDSFATEAEIAAIRRFNSLSSNCQNELIESSGRVDVRYSAIFSEGYTELDRLLLEVTEKRENWGAFNRQYEALKEDIRSRLSRIDQTI